MNSLEISLSDRMKTFYENRNCIYLTRRVPVVMRLDGRSFHTFTRQFEKPFSEVLSHLMISTALALCNEISGCKCAYIQSDEISLLITDYEDLNTDAWFDYNMNKMVSVSASIATAAFNKEYILQKIINGVWNSNESEFNIKKLHWASFDSRAFNLPKEDVANYFIWRQKDWSRNSLQMLARVHYSHNQLENKSHTDIHEMLYEKKVNWADLEDKWKNGVFIAEKQQINPCPQFSFETFERWLYGRKK